MKIARAREKLRTVAAGAFNGTAAAATERQTAGACCCSQSSLNSPSSIQQALAQILISHSCDEPAVCRWFSNTKYTVDSIVALSLWVYFGSICEAVRLDSHACARALAHLFNFYFICLLSLAKFSSSPFEPKIWWKMINNNNLWTLCNP